MKDRLDGIELSGIRAFAQQYRSREDMVFLTIGEPNLDTPVEIKEALIASLNDNNTHYPPAMGDPLLRSAIAKHESQFYGEAIDSQNILITNGATEALALAFWSLLSKGNEAIVLVPSFPLYQTQIELMGAVPVLVDVSQDDFQLTLDAVKSKVNAKTKCLVFASPNNPTGTIYNENSYKVMVELVSEFPDLYIIVDEVYRSMVYDVAYPSIREYEAVRDRIILVTSFSKSHAMTGWRVGYVITPPALVDRMHKLHQNMVTGISSFSQSACIRALELSTDAMVLDYQGRRDFVLDQLDAMGLEYVYPEGAFYVFPSISEFGLDSVSFAQKMADAVGLVVIPGIYFGTDGFIRLSYGESMEILQEGMKRLALFVTSIR